MAGFPTVQDYMVCRVDFKTLDKNHTGVLERPEVVALAVTQLQREPTADELDLFMAAIDKNHDGKVQ